MRLNVPAFSVTAALFWGGSIFLVGVANLIWPPYGQLFLDLAASIYPGYHADPGFGSVLVGTGYGLVDGVVGGALFSWIYNVLAGRFTHSQA